MTSEAILSPEQYVSRHRRAFRVAFDYLNAHFPPTLDGEYWNRAAIDVGEACFAEGNDPLVTELLAGVYSYLSKEYKLRRDQVETAGNRND